MNKISNLLTKIKFKLALIIVRFVFAYIRKVKKKYYEACYNKLYVLANEHFNENDLGKNSKLAIRLTSIYIYEFDDDEIEVDNKELESFKLIADNDEWIKKNIADLYRIKSFSIIVDSELKNQYLEKARQLDSKSEPIREFKEIINLVKNIKKEYKVFLKEGRKLSNKRYEEEIEKRINPIEITSQNISFLLTLFSTFFLISGIIYSKLYFYLLGINISDFFSVSDYLSSSIDTLIITFISISIGMIFYFIGEKDRLKTSIYEEQFQTTSSYRKKEVYSLIFALIMCVITFFVAYFMQDRAYYNLLYPVILFVFFRYFWSLPIWKYFKSPEKVGFVLMSFSTFIISLVLTALTYHEELIHKKVEDNEYNILLKDKSHDINKLIFITTNSNNLFMLTEDTKKVKIIPLYNVESIEHKYKKNNTE